MKISELDTAALADIREAGYVPAITSDDGGGTVRLPLSEFAATGESGSSGGSDGTVAVDAESEAGYLEDVLVSDSDVVTLVKSSGQLRIAFDTELSTDPKIETCTESQTNTASSNYGSYALGSGYKKVVWGDSSSASYINAMVYQMQRLSSTQGTVTKVNLAITGSLALTDPPACFAVGLFDTDGAKLGDTGLLFYGDDWENDSLASFDITEAYTGSLALDRNVRYIIQLWSCGVQFAALDRSDSNYTYDFTLRQNLQGSTSSPDFADVFDTTFSAAATIPYISFGAKALN